MTHPDTTEYRQLPPQLAASPPGLPEIPGGWTSQSWEIDGRTLSLTLPAVPDAFLDDPAVMAAHQQSEYMPYWAYLWPAAVHMARTVLRKNWTPGTSAIELGAGVGLVGLAACHGGLDVTFTDYDPTAVELCLHNARTAGFANVQGQVIDWQQTPHRQYPVILGCEILYEDRNHDLLIPLLQRMLPDDGVAWFGDGGRTRAERFCRLLPSAGFQYRLFDEEGAPLPLLRVGRYQLIEIRKTVPTHSPSRQSTI